MDKKEVKKIVASIIVIMLIIAVGVFAATYVIQSNVPAIQLNSGSAAYKNFIASLTFQLSADANLKMFMIATAGIVYLGALLFLIGLIVVFAKRSIRFILLPIVGLIAFVIAGFTSLCYYQISIGDKSLATLGIILLAVSIALAVLGLLAFIFAFAFPRRLLTKAEDKDALAAASEGEAKEEKEEKPAEEEPVPAAEEAAPVEEEKEEIVEEKAEEPESEPEPEPEPEPEVKEEEPAPVEEAPVEEPKEEEKAKPAKKAPAKKAEKPAEKGKAVGKYEVFPEAGFFKYRLKANNGEILIVSNPYRTKESALAGIDTLKKNVPLGNHKVITDKNKFGQFRIFTGNDSRLVVAGEIYPTAAGAEKALASVLKFYDTDRINVLEDIPESEHREWHLDLDAASPLQNGKMTISVNEEGKFQGSLTANNGELLFITSTYSGKPALKKALGNLQEKLLSGENITVSKDKQNRYQFRLYSDNGMLLLMGETYPSYDSAAKAANSARNFIAGAKVVE